MSGYAELQATSNFSFLRGGSHPQELVAQAHALGLAALAITDRNTLAGVVRAHVEAKRLGLKLIIGCRLDLRDGPSMLCLPTDRAAYGRLSRLLSLGKARAKKGDCHIDIVDVRGHADGQVFILLPPDDIEAADLTAFRDLARDWRGQVYLAASRLYRGDDRRRLAALADFARRARLPLVATNDVHYHAAERRPLQDVLTCIREKCRIDEAGWRLAANAERHLKPAAEIARLFTGYEDAVARSVEIAGRCSFSLDDLKYEYPDEPVPPGKTAEQHLDDLTWQGFAWRYPKGAPAKVAATVRKELEIFKQRGFTHYLLTVHDIVGEARRLGILCQGRGSAANSAVCYCLGVTSVDPTEIDLLFDRFVSEVRKEPTDIDVDFEHERREEIIQYIYARYGRDRAGLAATVISYRSRSALRDVGKVMGLTPDGIVALSGLVWGLHEDRLPAERIEQAGLDPNDPLLARVIDLALELKGFPRHLSQHVGGFVLTQGPLIETVPIGNAAMADRTFIEWNKDDIDALQIMKVDILALGMLSCIRRCFDLMERHYGDRQTLASVPQNVPGVYQMLQRADAVGVFQVESRAQMNMLPRLKPKVFYDLVIEVAIVRPGPIQGNMVHPYLRRRALREKGETAFTYPGPHPDHGPPNDRADILAKTLGVPLFQEQAIRIAMDAAKFNAEEISELRYAMATFRSRGTIGKLESKLVGNMVRRGYPAEFANRVFSQIKGFGEYGFPESHAASFALLVYVSAWLKWKYPEVFAAGLLNAQPMGFYAPAQIVRDAREHGVKVLPVDINRSDWDCTLEPPGEAGGERCALRLGFRQADGLSKEVIDACVARRGAGFADIEAVHRRGGLSFAVIERLAAADGFNSIGLNRRQALWQVRALRDAPPLPLFEHVAAAPQGPEPAVALPLMPKSAEVVDDYRTTRLSLRAHPLTFLRERYNERGVVRAADLALLRDNARLCVAGLVLVRQMPESANGVVFLTLEDESGAANVVIWRSTFEAYRRVVMGSRLILVHGVIQRQEDIIHVVGRRMEDASADLSLLSETPLVPPLSRADEVARPQAPSHPRNRRVIPRSRDFH